MRMNSAGLAVVLVLDLLCESQPELAQNYEVPRLPGAELLERSLLPDGIVLATENTVTMLPESLSEAFLSISSDGNIIGAVRTPRHIISTYSIKDGKLTDYPEVPGYMGGFWGTSEISPDGKKMAYVTRDARADFSGVRLSLRILDFRTQGTTVAANPPGEVSEISWSPDGQRIAFDINVPSYPGHSKPSEIRTINIVDLKTSAVSEIGVGGTPSWSPSGEWIAYVGYVQVGNTDSHPWNSYAGRHYSDDQFELRIMSPEGASSRRLMKVHSSPNLKPLWSPDSQTLLLQVMNPDTGTVLVYMVDTVTGKATKEFKNAGPVYAWIAAN